MEPKIEQINTGRDKVYFMSSPKSTGSDRRTWLIRLRGEPSCLVRVYPNADAPALTKWICDCSAPARQIRVGRSGCKHIAAAIDADNARFFGKENKQ